MSSTRIILTVSRITHNNNDCSENMSSLTNGRKCTSGAEEGIIEKTENLKRTDDDECEIVISDRRKNTAEQHVVITKVGVEAISSPDGLDLLIFARRSRFRGAGPFDVDGEPRPPRHRYCVCTTRRLASLFAFARRCRARGVYHCCCCCRHRRGRRFYIKFKR